MYIKEPVKEIKNWDENFKWNKNTERQLQILRFANDIVLFAEKEKKLWNIFNGMYKLLKRVI